MRDKTFQAACNTLKTVAVLHRGGLLTAVWVPDAAHEAMRDGVGA
jgi:hypothetical protein